MSDPTELERLTEERDQALAKARDMLIRGEFIAEATKAGARHPEDVYALADRSEVDVNDIGAVSGVTEAVAALVKSGRVPMRQGAAEPAQTVTLSKEERAICRGLGITFEQYAAQKARRPARSRPEPTREARIDALRRIASGHMTAAARERIHERIHEIEEELP